MDVTNRVTDHRLVCRLLAPPAMVLGLALAGCQSTVDPGRSMRPIAPSQDSNVIPPSGRAVPLNSVVPNTTGVERQPAAGVLSLPQADAAEARYHTVQKGDSWSSIATKYTITVPQLTQANGIDASTVLQPGQMIYIPEK